MKKLILITITTLLFLPIMAKNGCKQHPHAIGVHEVKSDSTCNIRNIGNQKLYVKITNYKYTPANCTSYPNEDYHCIFSFNPVIKETRVYSKSGCTGEYYVNGTPEAYENAAQKTNSPCTKEPDTKPQS